MNKKLEPIIAHFREFDNTVQILDKHLLGTSELGCKFGQKIEMNNWGSLMGLIHDMGKGTESFQKYIQSASGILSYDSSEYINYKEYKGKIDHSYAGAKKISNERNVNDLIAQIFFLIIKSHHGGLIDCLTPDGKNIIKEKITDESKNALIKEAIQNMSSLICSEIEKISSEKINSEFHNKIARIKEISKDKEAQYMNLGLLIRLIYSILVDSDRTDTISFNYKLANDKKFFQDWELVQKSLEEYLGNFTCKKNVDKIRKKISDECKAKGSSEVGIYRLTVPTGGGKTLASLRFAIEHLRKNSLERIIYIIPFTTIIDQNAQVVRSILKEHSKNNSFILEYHSNLSDREEKYDNNELIYENWDYPIVFTTMVQFLDTFFSSGTKSVRRLHNLCSSVIIFDEIQTLPPRFIKLFDYISDFMYKIGNTTSVLCTATQPKKYSAISLFDSSSPSEYFEIVEKPEELFRELNRVDLNPMIKKGGWSDKEVACFIKRLKQNSSSILVIVNTKKTASALFEMLEEEGEVPFHLSTSMCPAHRKNELKTVIEQVKRARKDKNGTIICISTQLIEAGVDVDFDTVIRFMAGLDSVSQAAGRCNRNGELKKGQVYIINSKDEKLSKLREIRVGSEVTTRMLNEFEKNPKEFDNNLLSPKSMERYFEYYYYEMKEQVNYPCYLEEYGIETNLVSLLSDNEKSVKAYYHNRDNADCNCNLPFSFKTAAKHYEAIDSATQGVLVPYSNEGEKLIEELCSYSLNSDVNEKLNKAQQYSVNLYINQIVELKDKNAINEIKSGSGIYYLKKEFYDNKKGLVYDPREMDSIIL